MTLSAVASSQSRSGLVAVIRTANGSAGALPYNAVHLYVTAPDDLSPLGDVDASATGSNNVFAVFPLTLQNGSCQTLTASNCALDAQ